MIKPGEIQKKAREVRVRDQQIEKDYILSWILQGIAQHEQLSIGIVFKGQYYRKYISKITDFQRTLILLCSIMIFRMIKSLNGFRKYLNTYKMKPTYHLRSLTITNMKMVV